MNDATERWLPVVGYEGSYEVSDLGRVRSLTRHVKFRSSRKLLQGQIMKPQKGCVTASGNIYWTVGLCVNARPRTLSIHRLVLLAFVGPPPPGHVSCHGNGNSQDNRLTNLRWDTESANSLDALKHGVHPTGNKTHCPQGHAYSPENTRRNKHTGYRGCRTCHRISERTRYHSKRAA